MHMRLSLALFLFLTGCANHQYQQLSTPSSGSVSSGLSQTKVGITKAQSEQQSIAQSNSTIQSNLQRADSKDALIKAWRVWKKTHP